MQEEKMANNYSYEELKKLHHCLYDILKEIKRVCNLLDIKFVTLGGSAIGVYFWNGIIPFDDDIDIGMKRTDYDRFLKEAPALLGEKYFLQWYKSDYHTPLFFAKIRKNDTLFMEEGMQNIEMHQGIFIDILPLDKIPNNPKARFLQRKLANIVNDCFVAKEIWRYKWLGKCQTATPLNASWMNCLFVKMISKFLSKDTIYRILHSIQTFYNDKNTNYCNTIPAYVDYMSVEDIEKPKDVVFGDIQIWAPSHLEEYLHLHYPNLKKELTEDEIARYSHRPLVLQFSDLNE